MSEQTVAVYLTKTEIGDIRNGLVALSDVVDTNVVPRIASLREEFREFYKGFETYQSPDQISFIRPEGLDVAGFRDEQGEYFAVTGAYMDDLGNKMNALRQNYDSVRTDGQWVTDGWAESQKEIQRLEANLKCSADARDFWFKRYKASEEAVKNLEAQRDVLIRAIGDLGNMVKA